MDRQLAGPMRPRAKPTATIHPYLAASGLVSILESLAAHADRVHRFDASKKQLVDTCARMIYSTVAGAGAVTGL